MTNLRKLPERFREWVLHPPDSPAVPKDAATVIVVRDGDEGIEAYFMRRHSTMEFAAGMYVFPGGGVHESDLVDDIPWLGTPPSVWAARFGCDETLARGLVVAGVRETFEESQVLLAGPDEVTVVSDTRSDAMQAARGQLDRREISFSHFLRENGLYLRADLLGAWAHWITPVIEPRRYDTRFLVAVLPEGQSVGEVSRESDRATWVPLSRVLRAVDEGRAAMMAPTVAACRSVAQETVDTLLAAALKREIVPIEPRVVEIDGDYYLESEEVESRG